MSAPQRTIYQREVAFPMRDAYGPIVKTRSPVSGINAWPRRQLLGRHYYGLDQDEGNLETGLPGTVSVVNAEKVKVFNEGNTDEISGFAGFADAGLGPVQPVIPGINGGGPGPMITVSTDDDSGGGLDWGAIIAGAFHAAPAIIQAAEGGGTPAGYYQQATVGGIQRTAPAGYVYNAQGQLVSTQSAYNALGGVGAGTAQIANSLTNFVTQNPLLILGLGAGLLLLFTRPPSRR